MIQGNASTLITLMKLRYSQGVAGQPHLGGMCTLLVIMWVCHVGMLLYHVGVLLVIQGGICARCDELTVFINKHLNF